MNAPETIPKILIAGVGNELRQDDAFGLLVARELINDVSLHANVTVQEFGIGGIHLVQELHGHYDILVILDAVSWEGKPGQIFWRSVATADIHELPKGEKRNFLADMHYTNPVRALMLAKAVNVLPKEVYILGCEAGKTDDFAMEISNDIQTAIPLAVKMIKDWLNEKVSDLSTQAYHK